MCLASLEAEPARCFPDLLAGYWSQGQASTEGAMVKGAGKTYSFHSLPALSPSTFPGSAQLLVFTPEFWLGPWVFLGFGSQEIFSFWPSCQVLPDEHSVDQLWKTFLEAWSSKGGIAWWVLVLVPALLRAQFLPL